MRRIVMMFLANLLRLPHMIIATYIMASRASSRPKEKRYRLLRWIVRCANWGGRVSVEADGLENLPSEDGYILYPNHQGMYDVLTLINTIDRPFSPIAKIETASVPLLGAVLRVMGAEFMDRSDVRQSLNVITSTAGRVKNGENFVIFAEGTRSRNGNVMNPFKPGAFKAATLAHAPIVPVALVDCFIPFDRKTLKRVTVQAHILPPIPYEEYKGMHTNDIAAEVERRIGERIAQALAERGEV